MKRIKSLPLSLRPRGKLLKYGTEVLNLEELLAVILITGNRVLPLSKIVTKVSRLVQKKDFTKNDLSKIGIGNSKTAQILASLELGKRLLKDQTVKLTSPEQVFVCCQEIMDQEKESVLCFYLNGRDELIKKELIAVGSLNNANLLPCEIFSQIKNLPVSSIILVHNHPSGKLEASKEDLHFTQRVKLAGDILGVKLLDHLIVSKQGWTKFEV